MRRRVFAVYFRQFLAHYLAYRVDAIFWVVNGLVWPVIMIALWGKIAEGNASLSMKKDDFVGYFLLSTLVVRLTQSWSAERISNRIGDGRFSLFLLKPIHYLTEDFAHNLATKTLRLITLTPFIIGLSLIFSGSLRLKTGPLEWLLFLLACLLGFFVRYAFEAAFSALAFFITETEGLGKIWGKAVSLIDGFAIPIVLLPSILFSFAKIFYTRFIVSFPLEIILGQIKGAEIFGGFLLGIGWIIIFAAGYRILWAKGLKKYTAVGM